MQSNKTSQNTRFNQVSCIFVVNLKRERETLLKKKKKGERELENLEHVGGHNKYTVL